MNKQEFLQQLRQLLAQLPPAEAEKTVSYFSEMIDDMVEDGLSEQEAVAQLGDVRKIAEEVLSDAPLTQLVSGRLRPISSAVAVLLIIGSPLWLPLLLAALILIVSFFIVLFSLAFAFTVAAGSCVLAGIATAAFCIVVFLQYGWLSGGFLLGASLISAGVGLLLLPPSLLSWKGAVLLCRTCFRGIKRCFIRKENRYA